MAITRLFIALIAVACSVAHSSAAALPSENVLSYPPLDRSRPRPLFVMLHGMCGAPEHSCPHFAATTARLGWLVCPRAARPCDGGGTTWSYREREQTIQHAIERAHQRFPGEIDESAGRTLIGFSLGAFVATELAQRFDSPAPYRRVLLIGARVFPDVASLKRAGVLRIVLAAGKYDMTYAHMAAQTRRLTRAGVAARFIDLGRVGHRLPVDFDQYLAAALTWLNAPESSPPAS